MTLKFSVLPGSFAVCQLPRDSAIPPWANTGAFFTVTRSADELSVVCAAESAPDGIKHEKPWTCLKLAGPFPFQMTGVLASFLETLADAEVPIFAVSTYDTDYVLIKQADATRALAALTAAGHELV